MPKSLFRDLKPVESPGEPNPIPAIRKDFLELIRLMVEELKVQTRMDIRDKIAALSLIDKVLAREKTDDHADAGSAVRKYTPNFASAYGAGRRTAHTTGQSPDDDPAAERPGWDSGADEGERDEPSSDEDGPSAT